MALGAVAGGCALGARAGAAPNGRRLGYGYFSGGDVVPEAPNRGSFGFRRSGLLTSLRQDVAAIDQHLTPSARGRSCCRLGLAEVDVCRSVWRGTRPPSQSRDGTSRRHRGGRHLNADATGAALPGASHGLLHRPPEGYAALDCSATLFDTR